MAMKVKQLIGQSERVEKEQNCPEFCLPKCYIGLEYEWENSSKIMYPNSFLQYYSVKSDGSLREGGREFVFKGPLSGTLLLNAINAMDELARAGKFTSSYRTSLHCHMDMCETFYPDDIILLGMLYCITEPFVYRYIGNGRDGCNYCIPWYSHPQHYQVFLECVAQGKNFDSSTNGAQLKNSKQFKYSGLNFFSLGDFGTIEWRHAPVNMQRDKIIQWINIIMRHKKFVMEHKNVVPDWLITYAQRRGPLDFLIEVFDQQTKPLLVNTSKLTEDFELGLSTAYHYLSVMKGVN